jgi:hypothetical protein
MNKVFVIALSALVLFQFGCEKYQKHTGAVSNQNNPETPIIGTHKREEIVVCPPSPEVVGEQDELICPARSMQVFAGDISTSSRVMPIEQFSVLSNADPCVHAHSVSPVAADASALSILTIRGRPSIEEIIFRACDQDIFINPSEHLTVTEHEDLIEVAWLHQFYDEETGRSQYQGYSATISKEKVRPLNMREVICERASGQRLKSWPY